MKDTFLFFLTYLELIVLSVILILIIRNVLRYVIKLKHYTEFHLVGFYSLAFLIISFRIAERILVLIMNHDNSTEESLLQPTWVIKYACRQLESMLAAQQLCQMVDL